MRKNDYKTKAKKIPVELEAEIDRLILEWKIKRREIQRIIGSAPIGEGTDCKMMNLSVYDLAHGDDKD